MSKVIQMPHPSDLHDAVGEEFNELYAHIQKSNKITSDDILEYARIKAYADEYGKQEQQLKDLIKETMVKYYEKSPEGIVIAPDDCDRKLVVEFHGGKTSYIEQEDTDELIKYLAKKAFGTLYRVKLAKARKKFTSKAKCVSQMVEKLFLRDNPKGFESKL